MYRVSSERLQRRLSCGAENHFASSENRLGFLGPSGVQFSAVAKGRSRPAFRSLPESMLEADYFIAIFDDGPAPHVWRWEIARVSSPMGVRLGGDGCRSRMAAEFAGARALKDFLGALAAEESRALRAEKREIRPGLPLKRQAN